MCSEYSLTTAFPDYCRCNSSRNIHPWYFKLTGGLALKLCILRVAEYIEQWTACQRWSLGRQAMRIIVAKESGAIQGYSLVTPFIPMTTNT